VSQLDENTGSEPKVDENKPTAQFESYVAKGAQHIVLGIYSPAGHAKIFPFFVDFCAVLWYNIS
jgi:hypothetical protein